MPQRRDRTPASSASPTRCRWSSKVRTRALDLLCSTRIPSSSARLTRPSWARSSATSRAVAFKPAAEPGMGSCVRNAVERSSTVVLVRAIGVGSHPLVPQAANRCFRLLAGTSGGGARPAGRPVCPGPRERIALKMTRYFDPHSPGLIVVGHGLLPEEEDRPIAYELKRLVNTRAGGADGRAAVGVARGWLMNNVLGGFLPAIALGGPRLNGFPGPLFKEI